MEQMMKAVSTPNPNSPTPEKSGGARVHSVNSERG
jgi:hypothetical protein